ncbi:DUF423 domain-containing protein [Candidatus Thioglobus sp.]|uniref:DUF423 domain-containing protein n=1 Tax=Candidatus Thioglobus sp. TaxID=2026721 RepID=UPI0026187F3B|nr:DUF423 domain-containing protein [Candidatus Thioglobus sp.]MDG2394732.1 DUF423 domain-containing protein [Candidatus Thioglobus sp.]
MKKLWIFIGLSGALAVAAGAMSAHLLVDMLNAKELARIQTAATYQMYHTIVLAALCAYYQFKPSSIIKLSCILFTFAIVLFSGSLYLYTATYYQPLVFLTPIGGLLFMVGWLNLIRLAMNKP